MRATSLFKEEYVVYLCISLLFPSLNPNLPFPFVFKFGIELHISPRWEPTFHIPFLEFPSARVFFLPPSAEQRLRTFSQNSFLPQFREAHSFVVSLPPKWPTGLFSFAPLAEEPVCSSERIADRGNPSFDLQKSETSLFLTVMLKKVPTHKKADVFDPPPVSYPLRNCQQHRPVSILPFSLLQTSLGPFIPYVLPLFWGKKGRFPQNS